MNARSYCGTDIHSSGVAIQVSRQPEKPTSERPSSLQIINAARQRFDDHGVSAEQFYARRVGRLGLALLGALSVLHLFRIGAVVFTELSFADTYWNRNGALQLLIASCVLLLVAVPRSARLASRAPHAELVAFSLISLGISLQVFGVESASVEANQGMAAALGTALGLTNLLVARAVIVPTTSRMTVAVGLVVSIPPLAAVVLSTAAGAGDTAAWNAGSRMVAWLLVGTIVASLASGLLYDLRGRPEGRRLGPYELLETIGRGGMGVVYRAQHDLLKRPVAIKVRWPSTTLAAQRPGDFTTPWSSSMVRTCSRWSRETAPNR